MTAPPPQRPDVVLFDVFETLVQLEPLRQRLADVGRPGHELELVFTRLLRDGMALTLAGDAPPFADVARAALRTVSGNSLDGAALDHVVSGFRELPAQPDAAPAIAALVDAGVPAWAFTHGSAEVAGAALERAGLLEPLRGVLSAAELRSFKPPPRVYTWACEQVGATPARAALVAVHSWDTHGAGRAGLLTGYCSRLDGELPAVFDEPTVQAPTLDGVVRALLEL